MFKVACLLVLFCVMYAQAYPLYIWNRYQMYDPLCAVDIIGFKKTFENIYEFRSELARHPTSWADWRWGHC